MANCSNTLESASNRCGFLIRLTEDELARFHAGDHELFRRVVEECSPRLLAFVRPFAADSDGAHDLLQDMWRRAYEKRRTFRGTSTLIGWLYAICRNLGLAAARKRVFRESVALDPADHTGSQPDTPDVATEHAELRVSINRALMDLPDRERDVVVLRLLDGKSTRETSQVLSCAEGTVKAALHHALKKLQSSMEVWIT